MDDVYDAIVVGAAISGSMTAISLARAGWRVALIEKRQPNTSKACGCCLSPRVAPILESAGLMNDVQRLSTGRVRRVRIHIAGRPPIETPLVTHTKRTQPTAGWLVPRAKFDDALRQRAHQAGVRLINARAKVMLNNTGLQTVQTHSPPNNNHPGAMKTIRSPLVIGADGLGSTVARAAGLSRHPSRSLLPVKSHQKYGFSFDIPPADPAAISPQTIEMFVSPAGYLGVVQETNAMLHVGALVQRRAPSPRDPFGFVAQLLQHHPTLRQALGESPLRDRAIDFHAAGPMPWRPRRVANNRVALVGDAAGYVEPFTGEGMAWAIESANLLAHVCAAIAPGAWNAATAKHYENLWRRRIARRQRICKALSFAIARPAAVTALAKIATIASPLPKALSQRVAQA